MHFNDGIVAANKKLVVEQYRRREDEQFKEFFSAICIESESEECICICMVRVYTYVSGVGMVSFNCFGAARRPNKLG